MNGANNENSPPGWPGIEARWTSSAKNGVGTSINPQSCVWFTHSHGILNEIYYPDVDQACTRDLGLLITDGKDFLSEEKRHTQTHGENHAPGVPAFHIVNTCRDGRYRIEKDLISDPQRNVVLQRTRFIPLKGTLSNYHCYVLLAPHLGNRGGGNTAWVGNDNMRPGIFADRDGYALALFCSAPWLKRSVGFVGVSDGWQDVNEHKLMQWEYSRAEKGNVAMIGEIDLLKSGGTFTLAIGFGENAEVAGKQADASLQENFDSILSQYVEEWQKWQKSIAAASGNSMERNEVFAQSLSVLRTSESKLHPGGIIASLSVPWGFAKGDNDLGGYHLVWTRDLVEAAGALLAGGAEADVLRVIKYLVSTQLPDGHWSQNMWIDGREYWPGIQMDETAFPILLIDLAYRKSLLKRKDIRKLWPAIRKAVRYLVLNGPVTQEDRWEEDPGYSPFTLAVEIAGLIAASDHAEMNDEHELARYLRETADFWNSNIERWTYAANTDLAKQIGVEGYYVRIAPPESSDASSPTQGFVCIKNRPPGQSLEQATHIISPDMLALVRFGLRSAEDQRIKNSIQVIDSLLRVETKNGPIWHRYNDDGYGEHENGSPFDGTGIGQVWPLLVGERAHYELAAGNSAGAEKLFRGMQFFTNDGGMIPEQIWDSADMPERELFFGKPSGSAMPLVWAHAEYIKLARSIHDNCVFDTPPHVVDRYIAHRNESRYAVWRFNHKCLTILQNKILRVEVLAPAAVRWSTDDWQTSTDTPTRANDLGIHIADLSTNSLSNGAAIVFTFLWKDTNTWEGQDYTIQVEGVQAQ